MCARVHQRTHARASACMCVRASGSSHGGIRRVVACDVADVREREQRRDVRVIHQVAVAKPVHFVPVRACVRACVRALESCVCACVRAHTRVRARTHATRAHRKHTVLSRACA